MMLKLNYPTDKHHECKYEGETYEAGMTWNDGNCTSCECDYDVGVNCTDVRDHCDVTCDPMTQDVLYKDDECCPTCGLCIVLLLFSKNLKYIQPLQ